MMAFLRLEMSTPAFRFQGKPGPACLGLTEFVIICCFGVLLPLHKPCDWWEGDHVPRLWHDTGGTHASMAQNRDDKNLVPSRLFWWCLGNTLRFWVQPFWAALTKPNLFHRGFRKFGSRGNSTFDANAEPEPVTPLQTQEWYYPHVTYHCKEDPMKRYYSEKRIDERNTKDRCSLVKAGSRTTDFSHNLEIFSEQLFVCICDILLLKQRDWQ